MPSGNKYKKCTITILLLKARLINMVRQIVMVRLIVMVKLNTTNS